MGGGEGRFSLTFRRNHIGASQAPAIIGVSPFARPIEVFEEFLGLREPTEENEATELGHALEHGVAVVAARRLGLGEIVKGETLEHPRMPWLVATPDYLPGIEVKTVGMVSYQNAEARERWGEDGDPEGAPTHVTAQAQTQMLVMRACDIEIDTMHVAALIANRGVCVYPVAYDDEIARMIVSQLAKFWQRVQDREPPPVDASDAFAEYIKRRYPSSLPEKWQEGPLVDELAETLRRTEAAFDQAEAAYKLARNQAQMAIGDAEGLRGPWGKIPWTGVRAKGEFTAAAVTAALTPKIGRLAAAQLVQRCETKGIDETLLKEEITKVLGDVKKEALKKFLGECKERGAGYRRFGPATWAKK